MLTIVTPATEQALLPLARLKTELSITDSDQDSALVDIIDEASAIVAGYCNRDGFGSEVLSQTERLSGRRAFLILERDLALDVTGVTVDGTTLTEDDFEREGALLYRLSGGRRITWSGVVVVIDYTAGFALPDAAPVDLARVALDLSAAMYRGTGRDTSVRLEQVEGVGQTAYFETKAGSIALSGDRVAALDRYRLVSVG